MSRAGIGHGANANGIFASCFFSVGLGVEGSKASVSPLVSFDRFVRVPSAVVKLYVCDK